MAVQFILGRSGTGKTSYCLNQVITALLEQSEQKLILLVPEQATYQAERAIVSDKRIAGFSRLQVLSFDRLQFTLLGKNATGPDISRTGRQMIVHRILREQKGRLNVLSDSAESPGLSCQMADIIIELHRYSKTGDDIDELLDVLKKEDTDNLSYQKFSDIALVFREYLKFIEDKFIDPDIQLNQVCRLIADSFVSGAKVWVDSFAGFTASELSILAEILKSAADSKISLCIEPDDIDIENCALNPADWFYPTKQTYSTLNEIIKKCRLKLDKPVILEDLRRFDCRQLEHIERNIFNFKPSKQKVSDNIQIISAANARSEIQFVAGRILKLVTSENMRYRDIAVIAPDIDSYEHYIRAYFGDCRIPFFIDRRKSLTQHPFVNLICSALQAVTGGFSSNDVFAYLKSDLTGISRYETDLLENYCLAFGINGSDWTDSKSWNFQGRKKEDFDERQINQIRLKAVKPLLELKNQLAVDNDSENTISAEDFTKAVFDFLENINFGETITGWLQQASETEDLETVDRHRQAYEKIVDVFDEITAVFNGHRLTCKDYFSILMSAFSQLTMAFIPPALDQVLVGSIERSRHPDLKAVFLIGAAQKQFPVPITDSSLLSDDDRTAAAGADFPLAPTTEQTLAERQYLAYIAFTRASRFLCVSYPMTDDKGSNVVRSQFIDELEGLFDGLEEKTIEDGDIELSEENITSVTDYNNKAVLDRAVVEEIFGRQIKTSVTKLSTFASCPYRYFAKYVLELKKREEFKLEPLDIGKFYHRVLDALVKQVNKDKKDFAAIDDESLLKILNEQISKVIADDSFLSSFKARSRHNDFIVSNAIDNLENCVLAIAEMVRSGSFRPAESEICFGMQTESAGDFKLNLSGGRELFLSGKIDRIDIAKTNEGQAALVFDYKSTGRSFSWAKFYNGLDMQLPVYLLALRSLRPSAIAGAFYMPIKAEIKSASYRELDKEAAKFDYKAKGIFNGEFAELLDNKTASKDSKYYNFYISKDEGAYGSYNKRGALKPDDFESVLQFAERKMIDLGEDIVSGKIDISPCKLGSETACRYCEYKAVCRFDWQINDYNHLESLGKKEFLERAARING